VSAPYFCGIVEGFYGREWDWLSRRAYAEFLLQQGLNTYLYCPKGDRHLRKDWRQDWPAAVSAELGATARHFRERGLNWGVGLSPYALYRNYSKQQKSQLQRKVSRIDALGGNVLAVLFDDMPGDCTDLAARQAEIVVDVLAWTQAQYLLVCPTYYSYDPVLERFFGARPADYWVDLGAALPAEVGIFWTGNEVCSDTISCADVAAITASLGRAPVLWDNYPVNDGEKASGFLHMQPLPGREPQLRRHLGGHFCNPMNQPNLSLYPLSGLGRLYGGPEQTLEQVYGDELGHCLGQDLAIFEQRGLAALDAAERAQLIDRYAGFEHPAAREIVDWLAGKYRFDPACLTG
jgi:hyaluronoglucosaminidase